MNTPSYFAGVDVSKPHLDAHVLPGDHARRFANDATGRRELVSFLRKHRVQLAVLEATGGYERAAVDAIVHAGLNVHVAQPRVVHAFALSLKLRAKTDTIDAAVCARYAHDRHHELRHAQPPQPTLRAIQALTTRRDQLVQMRTMESNRSQQADDKATLKSLRRSLTWMDNEIAKIEKAIDKLIHDDESLRAKSHALQQTKGVGPQTTRVLLACLPELGKESPKRLNALVGVAPYARDSGDRKATRHIAGGRPLVRSGLYMACMTAVSTNPVIAPYYRQLTSRGLAHKTAMIACIRKLLAHLDRILRTPPRPPAPIPTTANA